MLKFLRIELAQGSFHLSANLSVQTQAVTAIIGPSGGGKSTLLSAVAGFLNPVSGSLIWGETDITDLSPSDRPVSILFQDNNLFPHLTIADNIGLALHPNLRLDADDKGRIADVLTEVGLDGLGERRVAAAGKTVLMVTHDPKDALEIADQVVLVSDGQAHAPVDTKAMFSDPPDALKEYLGLK